MWLIRLVLTAGILLAAAPSLAAAPFRPVDAYLSAWADLEKIPKVDRCNYRYLSFGHIPDENERETVIRILSFQVNALTRSQRLQPINWGDRPALVRMDIGKKGLNWPTDVWEHLVTAEPYFHLQAYRGYWPGGLWAGKHPYPPDTYTADYKWPTLAPHIVETEGGKAAAIDLAKWTGSQVPVVRGDWFLDQTAIQLGREGHGYADFLGLGKKAADWEKLIGADPKAVDQFGEIGALVVRSSRVAINNRQIRRRRALGGNDWFTIDVLTSVKRDNLVRDLDGLLKKQASRRVGALPNGLPAFWLEDAKGNRVDSVPDTFAGNSAALSPDTRVHIGPLTCITCHGGALHSIKDYVRDVLLPNDLLPQSPDEKKAAKLLDLYTTDLKKAFARDLQEYEDAISEVTGLPQNKFAVTYGKVWARYAIDDVSLDRAAEECGVTPDALRAALTAQLRGRNIRDPLDVVFAAWLADPPDRVRRDQFEESFSDLMRVLKVWGKKP